LKRKLDITPAELLARRSAKRRSAVSNLEKANQYDPEAWETTEAKVAALLPPNLLDDFVGFILGMRYGRTADAQKPRSMRETLEDIRQKLLRMLSAWLKYFEVNIAEIQVELSPAGLGLYSGQDVLAEIDRLKRLLAVLREYPKLAAGGPRINPDRPVPNWMFQLFEDYQRAFPKGRNGRPTGISRDGPANRFIVAAIELIGWRPMKPEAVENMLRREQRRMRNYRDATRLE
jgi:hypothetical protein